MITLAMVQAGYEEGHIKLIESPHSDGIVCQIGDNWFYFGGHTAEEYKDVDLYKKDIPREDIIKEIYEVLEDFSTELEDEYIYYDYYLRTQIEKNVFTDTETPHFRYKPKIVGETPVDEQDVIYTVSLEPGYMVDVKVRGENGLVYIMQNQKGNSVYGISGPDAAFRNYCFDVNLIVMSVKKHYIAENKDYDYILERCYDQYKNNWCKQHGVKPEDIDEEIGINGECYVCLDEFEQNEFQDLDYVWDLAMLFLNDLKDKTFKNSLVGLNIHDAAKKLSKDFYILDDQFVNHIGGKYVFVKPPDRRIQLTTDKENTVTAVKGGQLPSLNSLITEAGERVRRGSVKEKQSAKIEDKKER